MNNSCSSCTIQDTNVTEDLIKFSDVSSIRQLSFAKFNAAYNDRYLFPKRHNYTVFLSVLQIKGLTLYMQIIERTKCFPVSNTFPLPQLINLH